MNLLTVVLIEIYRIHASSDSRAQSFEFYFFFIKPFKILLTLFSELGMNIIMLF